MYQYPGQGMMPEGQQAQAPWPGAAGWTDGAQCMDPNMMAGANYNSYPAAGGAQGQMQPQMGMPMPNGMPAQGQPQYNGAANGGYGQTPATGYALAGPGGENGMNGGNGSYGGGGYGNGYSNGGSYGGGYGGGMDGDCDDYFYPRYNQGMGAEYAQNVLGSHTVEGLGDNEGLEVTIYGENGENIPPPVDNWEKAGELFPANLVQECVNAGFAKPMPIQANTWGIGTMGRDLIGVAKTGSGKTLAYLFLGFTKLQNRDSRAGPGMLILAPTRELAQQIEQESNKFGTPLRIRTACCYGGASRGPQLGQIRRGCQVIVATPGRLNDFIQSNQVRLNACAFLVLDEADRMLDLGFEPQIRTIIQCLPSPRQTLLYTATWPKELRSLASDFLEKPIHVHVGHGDKLAANKDITQIVQIVSNEQTKMEELVKILSGMVHGNRVLVFCETKAATATLARELTEAHRIYSVAIHGDLAQRDRDWALESFKSGRAPIMVATDVAGRGLDIKGITAVVNWDAAHNAEDYVHRIGRTARAGEKGVAYTFLTPSETRKARDIVSIMENTGLEVPVELLQLAGRGNRGGKGKGKGFRKGKGKGGGGGGKGKGGGGKGKFGGGFGSGFGGKN